MLSLRRLIIDQTGDSAIQYALVAGILSVIVLVSSLALREPILDLYNNVGDKAGDALTAESGTGTSSQ